jgi:hypothetical protein
MKFIQCCCKDENHGDMFDRLDLEFSKEKWEGVLKWMIL